MQNEQLPRSLSKPLNYQKLPLWNSIMDRTPFIVFMALPNQVVSALFQLVRITERFMYMPKVTGLVANKPKKQPQATVQQIFPRWFLGFMPNPLFGRWRLLTVTIL